MRIISANPEVLAIKHVNEQIEEGNEVVNATRITKRHLIDAWKNNISLEMCDLFIFWDVVLTIDIFSSESKVNQENFGIFIQGFTWIYHDILELYVIVGPLGTMSVLEYAHNLGSHIENFLNFLYPF